MAGDRRCGIRTKVGDIEYLTRPVFRKACKHSPIYARGDTSDRGEVCMVLLDEFDALVLFLPKLDMPVDRCGDEKLCAVERNGYMNTNGCRVGG